MTSTPFRLALQRCLLACLWLALPLGGGGGFAPAHAQEAQEDEEASDAPEWIEEIVVTATKRETDLMATPLAVTALGQEALSREGVQDALDLASLVPNLQVGHSPEDSGVQVTVRGITSNNFTELSDPTVGIHVDGMYSPRPQGGLALMHDVERVEILRGPQGTLFGRNSTSGAVNIITARPDFTEMSGLLEVELGKFEHKLARGWFNLPLLEDVALRASFMVDKTDSYIHQDWDRYDLAFDTNFDGDLDDPADIRPDGVPNVDQRRAGPVDDEKAYGNSNRWAYRVSALWQPSTYFKWLFSYDHYQDNGAGNISLKDCEKAAGTFFACEHPQYYTNVNVPGRIDMSITTFRSELVWDMPWLTVEYRFALADQDRFQQHDGDGGNFRDPDHPAWGLNRPDPANQPPLVRDAAALARVGFAGTTTLPWEDLQLTTRWSNYESDVHELQFKGDFDVAGRQLRWIAGFFDLREKNAIRFDVEIPFCCGSIRPLAQSFVQPDRQIISTAFFAQFDYQVSERLNLTFGYRFTEDKKSDNGGRNHETTGYWTNPNLFQDPNQPGFPTNDDGSPYFFWHEAYGLIGLGPRTGCATAASRDCFYQANNLLPEDGSLGENFPNRVPGTDNTTSAEWSKSTWRVGADYLVHEDLFVYGYVATGYKAGGFGDKIDPDGPEITDPAGDTYGSLGPTAYPYDPEDNITYEIGVKNTLLDGKLNLIANLFYSDYENMQRTEWVVVGRNQATRPRTDEPVASDNQGQDVGTLLTTNLAAAQILGLEFEFDWWELWPGGRVFGWISWLDTEITYPDGDDGWFCLERALLGMTPCAAEDPNQVRGDNSLRRPVNFTGNKLPWSPEWSMTINFEHNWYLPGGQRLSPFLSVSFVDEYFFEDNNFDEGPFHSGQTAIATMNFSLRYINEEQRWGAEIYVYNLTDELVRTWADPGPGYLRSNFAPPRSYGIKMRKAS